MPTPAEIAELRRKARESRAEQSRLGASVTTNVPAQEFTTPVVQQDKKPGFVSRLLSKATSPLIDVPDLPGGIAGEFVERGLEELSSPVSIASALLVPVTGGTSLGLRGAAGVGAKLATRGLAEAVTGATASIAAEQVNERLPENTPGYLRLPATLAAGAAGGILSARGVSAAVKALPGSADDAAKAAARAAAMRAPVKTEEAGVLTDAITNAKKIPRREVNALRAAQRSQQASRAAEGLSSAPGVAGINAGQAAARGAFERLSFEAPKIEPNVVDTLYEQAKNFYLDRGQPLSVFTARSALDKVLAGAVPPTSELKALEDVFGGGLVEAIQLHQGWGPRLAAAINLPRAFVATADMSAPLRQGILLAARHPRTFAKNFGPMVRAFFDEDYYNAAVKALDEGDGAIRASKAGLARTAGKVVNREEAFLGNAFNLPTNTATKTLGYGADPTLGSSLMKGSERAYGLFLDKMRRDVFDTFANGLDKAGLSNLETEKLYAAFLNRATGRGAEKVLEGNLGKVANAAFFAPNYTMSRFLAPTSLLTADPVVRKQVAQDLGAFIGTGVVSLGLLSYAAKQGLIPDLKVEADPRSSDFGKIRIGNQRYDFWGGYQQIARSLAQFVTGQSKSSSSGRTYDENRLAVLGRFAQSKLSPAAGLFVDVTRGETYLGDKLSLTPDSIEEQAYNRLAPLIFQDVLEGYQTGGIREGAGALPAFFGVGVTTFQSLSEIKNDTANRLFGKADYRDLTRAEKQLVDQDPRVIAKEAEYDGKAGNDYNETVDNIETQRLMSQQAFAAQLASGLFDYRQLADALEENQLRASVARNQARADFGIPDGAAPTSPLQVALDEYYNLYDMADYGYADGVKTGQINWDEWEALRTDLFNRLTPEQQDFIEASIGGRDSDPLVQWYFNNKKYVQDSGYWDEADTAFSKFAARVARLDPNITSYGALKATMANVRYSNPSLYRRLNAIENAIDKRLSATRESLRRKNPELDAALYLTGRTTTVLTRKAERIISGQ